MKTDGSSVASEVLHLFFNNITSIPPKGNTVGRTSCLCYQSGNTIILWVSIFILSLESSNPRNANCRDRHSKFCLVDSPVLSFAEFFAEAETLIYMFTIQIVTCRNLINILAEISQTGKPRHIPYRDSRLTFLLQESLGGNAKLAMVCAISPSQR